MFPQAASSDRQHCSKHGAAAYRRRSGPPRREATEATGLAANRTGGAGARDVRPAAPGRRRERLRWSALEGTKASLEREACDAPAAGREPESSPSD